MTAKTKAYLALIFICIVWGTTYYGIKIAVRYYPPFFIAGVRQVVSAAIIMILAWLFYRKADLSKKNLLQQALIGFLMITLGNGLVSWGIQNIKSGVAALICGLMPVAAVIINLVRNKTEKPNLLIIAGMALGLCGVGVIFHDSLMLMGDIKYVLGIIATLIATTSWAFGSILSKDVKSKTNPMFNAGLQVMFGGAFLLLSSPLMDDWSKSYLQGSTGLLALAYLILFGSVLAYTAYMFTLKVLPVGVVTVYAYINPLVAVLLGAWLIPETEQLDRYTLISFLLILTSVYLVNLGYRKAKRIHQNPA